MSEVARDAALFSPSRESDGRNALGTVAYNQHGRFGEAGTGEPINVKKGAKVEWDIEKDRWRTPGEEATFERGVPSNMAGLPE